MYYKRKIAAAATAALCAFVLSVPAAAQKAVSLGTSSVGSTFYVLAIGMSKIMQKHSELTPGDIQRGFNQLVVFLGTRTKAEVLRSNPASLEMALTSL